MDDILLSEGANENRAARMSVLAWHLEDGTARNLFTHIRHRRADGLGPWAARPDQVWRTTTFPSNDIVGPGEIQLHILDAPLEHCVDLVNEISDRSVITIDGIEVCYALERRPRPHRAYREDMRMDEPSVNSPFSRYSAQVTEFWSLEPEPRDHWRKMCDSYAPRQLERHLRGLAFPLDRLSDRVGNLMISGAEDEIVCALANGRTHLILDVNTADGTDLAESAYYATVWARDSGDIVEHRQLEIAKRHTVVNIDSELDLIGFAVFRRRDGQCVDRWEAALFRQVNVALNLSTSQTLEIHDRRRGTTNTLSFGDAKSTIKVGDEHPGGLDHAIRREVLERRSWQRDKDARAEGNLGRFGPDQTERAIDFLLQLLGEPWRSDGPIYLADPYFMHRDFDLTNERIYSSMFERTRGQQLRILTGQRDPDRWLSRYPSILTGHVEVKSFTSKDGQGRDRPAFHDRYLITPDKEIIITHSINGWHDQGVTFATLSHGVYRAEAGELWSLNIGDNNNGIHVQEIK